MIRTTGELLAVLQALPPETPVYADPEGDPCPMGAPELREVVIRPDGRPEYLSSWQGLRDYCLRCGTRDCAREGHQLRRDVEVTPVRALILEAG